MSSFDIDSKLTTGQEEYLRICVCHHCDEVLPYPQANHNCNMDTDDEGFSEKGGYIDAFDTFVRDFRDHVSECLTGCGRLHKLLDDDNDNAVCDGVSSCTCCSRRG